MRVERQFVENDLRVRSGPRRGEPLDNEGRERRLLELMRLAVDHARAREDHSKLVIRLRKIERISDDWATQFDS